MRPARFFTATRVSAYKTRSIHIVEAPTILQPRLWFVQWNFFIPESNSPLNFLHPYIFWKVTFCLPYKEGNRDMIPVWRTENVSKTQKSNSRTQRVAHIFFFSFSLFRRRQNIVGRKKRSRFHRRSFFRFFRSSHRFVRRYGRRSLIAEFVHVRTAKTTKNFRFLLWIPERWN